MDFTAADENSYKNTSNVENVIALIAIRRRRVYNNVGNYVRAFFKMTDTNRK